MILVVAFHLIAAHLPGGLEVYINPDEVVAMRTPPHTEGYVKEGVKCIVLTTDGKFLAIVEECRVIQTELERIKRGNGEEKK
jgi:hypothetical protein